MADHKKNKRSKMECPRCQTIISTSNKSHEENCDRFWNLLTKDKNRLWCTFCDKSYASISMAFQHMAKLHYNSVDLKNLVNLHCKDQFEFNNEEDDNWSDIEFDNGEVDKDQSCLNSSINIKENIIEKFTEKFPEKNPVKISKKLFRKNPQKIPEKDSVLVIDLDEEDDEDEHDIPDLEDTSPQNDEVKKKNGHKRKFGKSEECIPRIIKDKEKIVKTRHSDIQPGIESHEESPNKKAKNSESFEKSLQKLAEKFPEKIIKISPQELAEKFPGKFPQKIPEKNPQKIPKNNPQKIPEKIPQKIHEENPQKISEKTPQKFPENILKTFC